MAVFDLPSLSQPWGCTTSTTSCHASVCVWVLWKKSRHRKCLSLPVPPAQTPNPGAPRARPMGTPGESARAASRAGRCLPCFRDSPADNMSSGVWVQFPPCGCEGLCLCVAWRLPTLPTPVSGTLCLAFMPGLCQAVAVASTWLPGPTRRAVGAAYGRGVPCFLWAFGLAQCVSSVPRLGPRGSWIPPTPPSSVAQSIF